MKTQKTLKYPICFSRPLVQIIKEKHKYHEKWKNFKNTQNYNCFSVLRTRAKQQMNLDFSFYIKVTENLTNTNNQSF